MNFLAEQNIAKFRYLLETETDAQKRATIKGLLRQEESKLVRAHQSPARHH
jgi:hypothetical protein